MARASDAAYGAIKDWIQRAEAAPGSLIDEDDASRRLGMSRTPVREALLRLQSEGLVAIGRGRGIRVLPLSASDMRDIYQVITGLETVAVALLAARRPVAADLIALDSATAEMDQALASGDVDRWGEADERFHRELLRMSGNPKLHAIACQMRDFAQRAHMVAVRLQDHAYRVTSTARHRDLLAVIVAGPAEAASGHHLAQRQRGEDALVGIIERFGLTNL